MKVTLYAVSKSTIEGTTFSTSGCPPCGYKTPSAEAKVYVVLVTIKKSPIES
jgi:hypothetical protein